MYTAWSGGVVAEPPFAQELLHFASGLEPEERTLGNLEGLDERERIVAAPALLDPGSTGHVRFGGHGTNFETRS